MIRIFSDSTCDLSEELKSKYNITTIPLHVLTGEKEYLDGVNITVDELYAWSDENKTTPKTSAPSPEEVINLFKPAISEGDEIIVFSISQSMSTTNNVFHLVSQEMEAEDRIFVIDSANLSTGIGHLVIEAAIMANNGCTSKEIINSIEALKPRVRSSFVVDTLTYLHRGGRCSSVAAVAGTALKLHPKILVKDGAMEVGKKYRGKYDKIVLNYVKDMEANLKTAKPDRVFITHSGISQEIIDSVYNYLDSLNHFREILITRAGSVISSHCGYGTLGVLFIEDSLL